jgi:hypothetical protein
LLDFRFTWLVSGTTSVIHIHPVTVLWDAGDAGSTCARYTKLVQSLLPILLLLFGTFPIWGQNHSSLTPDQAQALVARALASESRAAQDKSHPMRYRLRKSTPRLTTTKEMIESKDGDVARLLLINDQPLNQDDEQKEQTRLETLLSDPSLQQHRKMNADGDAARALKVLRMLPRAFLYQFAGMISTSNGPAERFTFKPNPRFSPPDLETQVLTAMTGEIWIDATQERVVRLEGHLQQDKDFGWGILGRLYKGGWIILEQADVGKRQWRVVRFQMAMSARVLFKTKSFDTVEEITQLAPIPVGLDYRQAIQILRSTPIPPGRP